MKSAYNQEWIYSLHVIKQAKLWLKHNLIRPEQFNAINDSYKTPLFHPNLAIRILLFIATLIAASGVSGLGMLLFSDAEDTTIAIALILFGLASFMILERAFIRNNHYKSGVTEAIIYLACGFVVMGVAMLVDFDLITLIQLTCLLVCAFAAFRYLDIILTLAVMFTLSWMIFYHCFEAGGIFKNIIPFVFMITFSGFYFLVRKFKTDDLKLWSDNLLILEVCCLVLVYAGGNYLVVRELSLEMMDLVVEPGEDIPFAFLFYFCTVAVPAVYLFAGIKTKNVVLIRVGLVTLAFSFFTFQRYFLSQYAEIFLMVAGSLLILGAIILMRYLKEIRNGFTSENILSSAWANLNMEAFIISQTMGGNQPEKIEVKETGGGGRSGGGGASTSF
jgi:hypothetical protein